MGDVGADTTISLATPRILYPVAVMPGDLIGSKADGDRRNTFDPDLHHGTRPGFAVKMRMVKHSRSWIPESNVSTS